MNNLTETRVLTGNLNRLKAVGSNATDLLYGNQTPIEHSVVVGAKYEGIFNLVRATLFNGDNMCQITPRVLPTTIGADVDESGAGLSQESLTKNNLLGSASVVLANLSISTERRTEATILTRSRGELFRAVFTRYCYSSFLPAIFACAFLFTEQALGRMAGLILRELLATVKALLFECRLSLSARFRTESNSLPFWEKEMAARLTGLIDTHCMYFTIQSSLAEGVYRG